MPLMVCDNGTTIRLTVSNAIGGQYFPSATSSPSMGWRVNISSGNDNGVFIFNLLTEKIITAKAVPSTPNEYLLTLDNDGTNETLGITVSP